MSLLQKCFVYILALTCSPVKHNMVAGAVHDQLNQPDNDVTTPVQERIVGGTFAEPGELPYQVALSLNSQLFCGGVILDTHLILTAAHCVDQWYIRRLTTSLQIIAGMVNRTLEDHDNQQVCNVKSIRVHENYDNRTVMNDIALIELETPLHYNQRVSSISLPNRNEAFGGYVTVSGWGWTRYKGHVSTILLKISVPIVSFGKCKTAYRDSRYPVTSSHICAGETGMDTCQGDSGGPAICRRGGIGLHPMFGYNSRWILCGIISFGRGCGAFDSPGVYTRVANYIDWIEATKLKIATRGKCKSNYFYCSSGTGCIPREFLCDNEPDCEGREWDEDEQRCTNLLSCGTNQFRCPDGQCLNQNVICDGIIDCIDSSDEEKCPNQNRTCGTGEHQCGFHGRCIPEIWKCDNDRDCDDGSDEVNCTADPDDSENEIDDGTPPSPTKPCLDSQFRCDNGQCISARFHCDKDNDCRDGSDERGCRLREKNCGKYSWRCDNGQCIYHKFKCDGDFDCRDQSDESGCSSSSD